MKIINNGFEVLHTGALYCFGLNETRFVLSEDPPLEVIFRIQQNDSESGVKLVGVNDHTIAVVFENPAGLGYGMVEPARIGHFNGKELYVVFSMNMKNEDRGYDLFYTFSVKEVGNG